MKLTSTMVIEMHAYQLVAQYCTENVVNSLNNREFGKLMGEAVSQSYARDMIYNTFGLLPSSEIRDKNESGYDLRYGNLRIQVKFRGVSGKTPYSKAINNETTRRKSVKNENKIASGHVAYSVGEFDAIFIIISHNQSRESDDWCSVLVPVSALINPEKPDQLSVSIDPRVLERYKDWKIVFKEMYSDLNK